MADEREPQDIQLKRDHHNKPTMQFNENEPLATVPTQGEKIKIDKQSGPPDMSSQRPEARPLPRAMPGGEGPPGPASDIPSHTAAFPPNMDNTIG